MFLLSESEILNEFSLFKNKEKEKEKEAQRQKEQEEFDKMEKEFINKIEGDKSKIKDFINKELSKFYIKYYKGSSPKCNRFEYNDMICGETIYNFVYEIWINFPSNVKNDIIDKFIYDFKNRLNSKNYIDKFDICKKYKFGCNNDGGEVLYISLRKDKNDSNSIDR